LKGHFRSGSVYSRADALPSAFEQIVVRKEKAMDTKEDFVLPWVLML
jgi:hypothetical protein